MQYTGNFTLFLHKLPAYCINGIFLYLCANKYYFMNAFVANKIKSLRRQKGFSQEQVAEHLRISQSAYARIENGKSNSWVTYINPISTLFEVEPEELLKQDTIIINQNQQGGSSNNAYIINQLSEKLIALYEAQIKEKNQIINDLKAQLKNLN